MSYDPEKFGKEICLFCKKEEPTSQVGIGWKRYHCRNIDCLDKYRLRTAYEVCPDCMQRRKILKTCRKCGCKVKEY